MYTDETMLDSRAVCDGCRSENISFLFSFKREPLTKYSLSYKDINGPTERKFSAISIQHSYFSADEPRAADVRSINNISLITFDHSVS